MSASLKRGAAPAYHALDNRTVIDYLARYKEIAVRLGGISSTWKSREVGDGNLNLVFIVEGASGAVVVKQALPYVRLVGESWPLPLTRAHYEHEALIRQAKAKPGSVPAVYAHDSEMALSVMEYLSPHIILRKGLIQGQYYPQMAKHLGEFLGRTLYFSSDFALPAEEKKETMGVFLGNTAMCKITEDLIFDEPYFAAPMNRHTTPHLNDMAALLRGDRELKLAVQSMKLAFLSHAEAMIHGDLHTGSVMVTPEDTRVIDPEFSFYGPMGFDTGCLIANLFMSYFSQPGHESAESKRTEFALWLLSQIQIVWGAFSDTFTSLVTNCTHGGMGDLYNRRLLADTPDLLQHAARQCLDNIFQDTLGFAGCEIIRRIMGLAHVEDFESIADEVLRAACERRALLFARRLVLKRHNFKNISNVIAAAQ